MPKSYRIRTQVGVDKSIKVQLDQEFEFLEILSLKLLQSQIYTRPCSDYGVVVGRVSVNDGFGLPNCKVSVFIPLTNDDSTNPIIADLYPYKSLTQLNEDGYRYNLLPYVPSYSAHKATGTFFTREDVLTNPTLIEVFDKYYKYTAITNDSGDFMIFGVPVGTQILHLDVDLSDIGEFSLSPQDLIRMGRATESQVGSTEFKASSNLGNLPQIVTINRTVEVEPLWGQPEICNLGITRSDFDLTEEANILIEPTSIFMGSIFSNSDVHNLKRNCKPKFKQGNLCSLVSGPGEILAIRQTIFQDINGRPVLETVDLDQGGQVIDENGTWMLDLPMNLDYVITNEFGEQVLSNDPKKGIPTKGKYRFKVKWNQSPSLSENIKRGYFLIPNVKEWGWLSSNNYDDDPIRNPNISQSDYEKFIKSYSFSLDWNDYGSQDMIQEAINCEDRFYLIQYNKVYTVSQLIDRYRKGYAPARMIAIKHILDSECESDNNKFPTNDAFYRFDLLYLLFVIFLFVIKPLLLIFLIVVHVLAFFLNIVYEAFNGLGAKKAARRIKRRLDKLTNLKIPNLSYPDCSLCTCGDNERLPLDLPPTNEEPTNNEEAQDGNDSSVLSLLTVGNQYNLNDIFTDPVQITAVQNLLAGKPLNSDLTNVDAKVPQIEDFGNNQYAFTTSLPLAERINLFNSKAKYFDDNLNNDNPGGGVNRIQVRFGDYVLNSGKNHFDNVICLLIRNDFQEEINSGDLITFQDLTKSEDPNLNKVVGSSPVPISNSGGTSSMYGSGVNIGLNGITIEYAKEDGSNINIPITYQVEQYDDIEYQKFPLDREYFQVITAMTYGDFSNKCNPSPVVESLPERFFGDSVINIVNNNLTWDSQLLINPIDTLIDGDKQLVVFLVRGVDPHSSRTDVSYDLNRLFGYPNFVEDGFGTFDANLLLKGKFKLNHPIKGSYKAIKHDNIVNNYSTDSTYSNIDLFYNSFHFLPDYGTGPFSFSTFSSSLPLYYSSLNQENILSGGLLFQPEPTMDTLGTFTVNSTLSLKIGGTPPSNPNLFTYDYQAALNACSGIYYPLVPSLLSPPSKGGYLPKEQIDGITAMYLKINDLSTFSPDVSCTNKIPDAIGWYYSPSYDINTTPKINFIAGSGPNNNKIVMRSDRLPTSTIRTNVLGNTYSLQNNQALSIIVLSDDGESIKLVDDAAQVPGAGNEEFDGEETTGVTQNFANVLNTFTCDGMIPLGCYFVNGSEINQREPTPLQYQNLLAQQFGITSQQESCYTCDGCYLNGEKEKKVILRNGCYVLVTKPIETLARDTELLVEWAARIQIMFGACRDVWSHTFSNNWINGSLYAFAFKNDRFFDSQNKPNSKYCKDPVMLHPTSLNFYYRSSPWRETDNSFIGSESPTPTVDLPILGTFAGNQKNLKYPTTIIDLGPRADYLQEINMSDDYDGYVMSKLSSTSYNDVEDILNYLILTRLVNTSFISKILGAQGVNILNYFSRRSGTIAGKMVPLQPYYVDSDYAQAISVNSEIGVVPFTAENYSSNVPGQDPLFVNGGGSNDIVMGIFFSSDTQLRDFITPKRTIVSPLAPSTEKCAFNNFRVFSQNVPFYQWKIVDNMDGTNSPIPNSIFGSQKNDWYTTPNILPNPGQTSFYNNRYQSMDRVDPNSRYFRNLYGITHNIYQKGYIYGVDSVGKLNADLTNWDRNSPGNVSNDITVGAPFHFYFGLKKGGSAWDRFARKWIKLDIITD